MLTAKTENDSWKGILDHLPEDAYHLLAMLAINTAPMRHHSIQEVCGCMEAIPDKTYSGTIYFSHEKVNRHKWTGPQFKAAMDALVKIGWIDRPHGHVQCNPIMREKIVHALVEKGTYQEYANVLFAFSGGRYYSTYSTYMYRSHSSHKTPDDYIREIRHCLIVGDGTVMKQFLRDFMPDNLNDYRFITTLNVLFESPDNWWDRADFGTKATFLQFQLVHSLSVLKSFPPSHWNALIDIVCQPKCDPNIQVLLLDYALCTGKLDEIPVTEMYGDLPAMLSTAHQAFLSGSYATAAALYQQARSHLPSLKGAKNLAIPYLTGIFHALCHLHLGNTAPVAEIALSVLTPKTSRRVATLMPINLQETWSILQSICVKLGGLTAKRFNVNELGIATKHARWLPLLLYAHETVWFSYQDRSELLETLLPFAETLACTTKGQMSFPWIAAEMAEVAALLGAEETQTKPLLEAANTFREQTSSMSIGNLLTPKADWEIWLESLRALSEPVAIVADKKTETKKGHGSRLVWRMHVSVHHTRCEPYEQVWQPKTKTWSMGRPIAISRLFSELHTLDFLTEHDRRAGAHIKTLQTGSRRYQKTEYYVGESVVLALIGHPHLFLASSPTVPIELISAKPEIVLKKEGNSLHVSFFPPITKTKGHFDSWTDNANRDLFVIEETNTRYKVIQLSQKEQQIRKILGVEGKTFPQEAESTLTAMLGNLLGEMTVKTDAQIEFENVPEVNVDPKLYLYLSPSGEGLQAEFFVRPLGATGPSHRPGSGSERVIADIDGRKLQTVRNLADETKRRDGVIARFPSFHTAAASSKDQYVFETAIDALTLLSELKDDEIAPTPPLEAEEETTSKKTRKKKTTPSSIQSSDLEIFWPQGEKYSVTSTASFGNFNLAFSSAQEWLAATGSLKVDGEVYELQKLFELFDESSESRFVKLSDQKFLALTNEFRKRLGEFKRLSHAKGNVVQLHPLAAAGMEDFFDAIPSLEKNALWSDIKKRIEAARDFQAPFPKSFVGDMRDYQLDGYDWLARSAKWGVGCCLADDMGLGKTIQALALLLQRAGEGPALVVAPTSVCFNWEREAAKFAPTLKIKRVQSITTGSNAKAERDKLITSAKKREVLITSYTLLQQEIELFAKKKYATVILDESQAIKNHESNRAKAAFSLQAEVRIAMTGTPIENRLSELWSLFRFLNPGLFGSQKSFEDRFAIPIQRDQSASARNTLRRLVHPFILRRTKSQVLAELPARTEIVREIELSPAEAKLYEAARLNALKELQDIKDKNSGAGQLQILAALTRLRQLCCNPKMVIPDSEIESSKLEAFREIMEELLENRHKVLVFSQFVKHLEILKAELDKMGISYQYLDGSTPERERRKRVDAFQSGESDAFLISIKAGGSGLNLTAADYVIHVDPWWNPAVEDQATDRAHRIGQTRPVTVYRLITQGTIEEKIVRLHHEKRDLADKLLEGTDQATKLSADELIDILRG